MNSSKPKLRSRKSTFALLVTIGLVVSLALFAENAGAQSQITDAPETPVLNIDIPEVQFSAAFAGDGTYTAPYIGQYIAGVYQFLISVVGVFAAVFMMIGGFQWLTAGGDATQRGKAQKRITNALAGLILALGSYVILYAINPNLIGFEGFELATVERDPFTIEAKSDPYGEDTAAISGDCSQEGFEITDIDSVDMDLNASLANDLVRKLTSKRVNAYKAAAATAGIPWEMVAAAHYMEAGMDLSKSIMNGGSLCNTRDNSNLLRKCPICARATSENDLACGAKLLAESSPTPSEDDIRSIKLSFCRHNGCNSSRTVCPELHHYVAAQWDDEHNGYIKSGLDCVRPKCELGCLRDITKKSGGRAPGYGCCEIKVYDPNNTPSDYNPGGSSCNTNQVKNSQCYTRDGNTITYSYNPELRNSSNPCGSYVIHNRPGALTVYAVILELEEQGRL